MKIIETRIPDLYVIQPKVWGDNRGFFLESYNAKVLLDAGINYKFVQDNHSRSSYGVLRGIHFQRGIYAQTKLVRVFAGSVLDVVVDLRKGSPTYLEHFSVELSAENFTQLLIPKGFAHGFIVLTEYADFFYKCDQFYNVQAEGSINFADKQLNIDWKLSPDEYKVGQKDLDNPPLELSEFDFPFEEYTESKLYA